GREAKNGGSGRASGEERAAVHAWPPCRMAACRTWQSPALGWGSANIGGGGKGGHPGRAPRRAPRPGGAAPRGRAAGGPGRGRAARSPIECAGSSRYHTAMPWPGLSGALVLAVLWLGPAARAEPADSLRGEGRVVSIDGAEGSITVDHEPIAGLVARG